MSTTLPQSDRSLTSLTLGDGLLKINLGLLSNLPLVNQVRQLTRNHDLRTMRVLGLGMLLLLTYGSLELTVQAASTLIINEVVYVRDHSETSSMNRGRLLSAPSA